MCDDYVGGFKCLEEAVLGRSWRSGARVNRINNLSYMHDLTKFIDNSF
jgi:hypothetical protein